MMKVTLLTTRIEQNTPHILPIFKGCRNEPLASFFYLIDLISQYDKRNKDTSTEVRELTFEIPSLINLLEL